MGIPSFFRWLNEKYSRLCSHARPGVCDVLLLDMNGILHPCCHSGEGNLHDYNEEEMLAAVMEYLDHIVKSVNPRQMVYLAVDGVAPRAKLNQQRARRYEAARKRRTILEITENEEGVFGYTTETDNPVAVQKIMQDIMQSLDMGILGGSPQDFTDPLSPDPSSEGFFGMGSESESDDDEKNKIGGAAGMGGDPQGETHFDKPIEELVAELLGWDRNCITPGSTFMQRASEALSDWITGKLASNEEPWCNLAIIMSDSSNPGEGEHKMVEFVRAQRAQPNYNPNTVHYLAGLDADLVLLSLALHDPHCAVLREQRSRGLSAPPGQQRFEVLSIGLLRQYLELEFESLPAPGQPKGPRVASPSTPAPRKARVDVERVIDDFILISFFVGNDFMPHLPGCLMDRCGMDMLLNAYRSVLPNLSDYLTTPEGRINWQNLGVFLAKFSRCEDAYFLSEVDMLKEEAEQQKSGEGTAAADATSPRPRAPSSGVRPLPELLDQSWRQTYYDSIGVKDAAAKDKMCLEFCQGLSWMLTYYFSGPARLDGAIKDLPNLWSWFYPSHYAPFSSDLANFMQTHETATIEAFRGKISAPFPPLAQLLAVLPPDSSALLPREVRWLMTSHKSPIADFYPHQYQVDEDGKTEEWKSIVLLPFIDEHRLMVALGDVELTPESERRNTMRTPSLLLLPPRHPATKGLNAGGEQVLKGHGGFSLVGSVTKVAEVAGSNGVHSMGYVDPDIIDSASTHRVLPGVTPPRTSLSPPPLPHPLALTAFGRFFVVIIALVYVSVVYTEVTRSLPLRSILDSLSFIAHATIVGFITLVLGILFSADISLARLAKQPSRSNYDLKRSLIRDIPVAVYKDWICTRCCRRNFDRNTACFRCGLTRQSDAPPLYTPRQPGSCIVLDHTRKKKFRGRGMFPSREVLLSNANLDRVPTMATTDDEE